MESILKWLMSVSCVRNNERLQCVDDKLISLETRLNDTYNKKSIDQQMKSLENQIQFKCEQVKHELGLQVNECSHKIEYTDIEIRNVQEKQTELKEIQLNISDKIQQNSENLHSILGFLEQKPVRTKRFPFR